MLEKHSEWGGEGALVHKRLRSGGGAGLLQLPAPPTVSGVRGRTSCLGGGQDDLQLSCSHHQDAGVLSCGSSSDQLPVAAGTRDYKLGGLK